MKIVQRSGESIASLLINGSVVCKKARIVPGQQSRCICAKHPDVVRVMKERHWDVWESAGHVHMPVMDAPWKETATASMNAKCEVSGLSKQVDRMMLIEMQKLVKKCGVGTSQVVEKVVQFASGIRAHTVHGTTDPRFQRGRVLKLKKLLSGWSITCRDRNEGQLMMSCPEFMDVKLREHYKYSDNVESLNDCKYWRVCEEEEHILQRWKCEYLMWSRKCCDGRWSVWNDKGRMSRVHEDSMQTEESL